MACFIESQDIYHEGQHKFSKGRLYYSVVLNKTLAFDILRQLWCGSASGDYNNAAAFSQVLHHLAMVMTCRLGNPKVTNLTLYEILSGMCCTTRTPFSFSLYHYDGTSEDPLAGSGQGGGNSLRIYKLATGVILDFTLAHTHPI